MHAKVLKIKIRHELLQLVNEIVKYIIKSGARETQKPGKNNMKISHH